MGKKAAIVALVAGAIATASLLSNELETRKIKKNGLLAQAEWTGETHKLLFGLTSMGFRFKTAAGETVSVSMSPNVTVDQLRNGEPVSIRYLERDPRKTARIAGNESGKSYLLWIGALLMLAYGALGIRSRR